MDTKAASSPALTQARLVHLYTAALSLSGPAPSSAAFLGDEALSLPRSATAPVTETTQAPINVLAQALARESPHRRLVGHVEFCNGCGLCLLPGTTARRVVKWTTSHDRKDEKTSTTRTQVPRPSKRRKIEWGPSKANSKRVATEAPPSKSKNELHANSKISKTAKAQKLSEDARKSSTKRVKSIDLHCIKCGGSTRLGLTPSATAAAKPAAESHLPPARASSTLIKPLPAVMSKPSAPPSSKNEKSKQRAKARKQGGLAAEVKRDKGAVQDAGGGLGFDLMDFMKG